jgi:hypothetical protein
MGKDFKSFYEKNRAENKENNAKEPSDNAFRSKQNSATESESGFSGIYEEINKFNGKSESELMSELFNMARKNKSDGTLADADLDAFKEQIAPYLSAEQNERLTQIVNQLKTR